MPFLISDVSTLDPGVTKIQSLNFIRIHRPETAPEKKRKEPVEKKIKSKPIHKSPAFSKKPPVKIENLRFEMNPRLKDNTFILPSPELKDLRFRSPLAGETFSLGELDGPLTPIVKTPPIYPLWAKRKGIEGWVRVEFIVTEKGRVESIKIMEASPENIFEKSVIRSISSWRFSPGTIEGIPVKTMAVTTVKFKLK